MNTAVCTREISRDKKGPRSIGGGEAGFAAGGTRKSAGSGSGGCSSSTDPMEDIRQAAIPGKSFARPGLRAGVSVAVE